MSSQTYFHRRRELINYARRLSKALRSKNQRLIAVLSLKVRALMAELSSVITRVELKKLLASAGLVILMCSSARDASAQSFALPVLNPFGLQDIYNGAWMEFVDIDDDGDLDAFGGTIDDNTYLGELLFFENIGTASEAEFAEPRSNPFGISLNSNDILMPTFVDIDDDGDQDLMLTYEYGMLYMENTGTASEPEFASPIMQPFGIQDRDYMFRPNFVDIDNDGDYDLIVGSSYYDYYDYETGIFFYENEGSASSPSFALPVENPFGPTTGYYFSFPTFADLDDDGDLDLLLGEKYDYYSGSYIGTIKYYENVGTKESPEFNDAIVNPFGLTGGYYITYPMFADIDADGDQDLFIGQVNAENDEYGSFLFFENLGSSAVRPVPESKRFSIYPNPANAFIDIRTDLQVESLQIIDASGRVLDYAPGRSRLQIDQLSPGGAVVRITATDGSVHIRKLIIVR